MSNLILYQRDDCHLCDLALAELAAARVPAFDSVFIDGDAGLEARYGERVPVLRDARRGAELDWPFDSDAVRRWLSPLLVAAVLPWTAVAAHAGEADLNLAKATASQTEAGAWLGRPLPEVLDAGAVERVVLTRAITSASGDLDLANVRRFLAVAAGAGHAGRRLRPALLRIGSENATWEGLLLMRSGAIYGFAIADDELCLHGARGERACWDLA